MANIKDRYVDDKAGNKIMILHTLQLFMNKKNYQKHLMYTINN